jgi:hypothetical protein
MSGSQSTNNAAVQFEQEQAAQAAQKDAERQQRLQQGTDLINQIFGGGPVMGTRTTNYDWSKFQPGNASTAPAGFTQVPIPGGTSTTGGGQPIYAQTGTGNRGQVGEGTKLVGYTPGSGSDASGVSWGLQDASGKTYKQGDPLSITESYDTGQKTPGFDDAFYNTYKQKYLDYYMPDAQRQYDYAKRDLMFNLARAHLDNSSAAADKQGELAYTQANNVAQIQSQANTAAGSLQDQIQQEKQQLVNQLYATEDPTLTANLAESAASAAKLQSPTLTPAATLFTPALVAAGAAGQNYYSPFSLYGTNPYGTNPSNVASANASSGRLTANS